MLEAVQIPAPSVPRTPAELDKAWNDVLDVVTLLKIPAKEPRSTALYQAREGWDLLRWNTERADWSKPYEPTDPQFQQHLAMFSIQKPIAEQLAAEYPKKVIFERKGPVIELEPLSIWGRIPPVLWLGLAILGGVAIVATRRTSALSGVARYSGKKLRERIADTLGWSVKETEKFSFQMLREMVKDKSPKLAHEILVAIRSGDLMTVD